MTKAEEKIIGLEKELEEMRGAIARLGAEQSHQLDIISRAVADIAELQGAIKRVNDAFKEKGTAMTTKRYGNTLSSYE